MNTIPLNNGIQMPLLGLGTFLMGGATCEESVLTALGSGYRIIDTAEAYAPLGQGRKNEMFENPALVEIAKAHGKTAAQVALRLLIQNEVAVIPKSVHGKRMQENFNLFEFNFELNPDEMARLVNMDTAAPMIGNPEGPAMVKAAMKW